MGHITTSVNIITGMPVKTYMFIPDDTDPLINVTRDIAPRAGIGDIISFGAFRLRVVDFNYLTDGFVCVLVGRRVWQYRWQAFSGSLRWKFRAWWRFTRHLWGWHYSPRDEETLRAMWNEDSKPYP